MSALIGVAEHYAAFVKLCRARIAELDITYDTVDSMCGFPTHYTATLMCEGKAMSIYSFFTMARALALLPSFQHDEAQLVYLRNGPKGHEWIKFRRVGPRFRPMRGRARTIKIYPDLQRKWGMDGQRSWFARTSPEVRSANARKAANARWGNR